MHAEADSSNEHQLLLHRIQILEQELTARNRECAELRTENRVLQSHSKVLTSTQGELLREQEKCARLQAANEALTGRVRQLESAQSKLEHVERMNALRRQLDHDNTMTSGGGDAAVAHASSSTTTEGVGRATMGGVVAMSHGTEIVLAPSAISSIGFASSTRGAAAQPFRRQEYNLASPQMQPHDDASEEDQVARLLDMAGVAVIHDQRREALEAGDDEELMARFTALQRKP